MPDGKRRLMARRINIEELARSPLADSVRQVLPGVQIQPAALESNVVGAWPWGQNTVQMTANPRKYGTRREGASMVPAGSDAESRMNPRGVLLHEAGHGYWEREGQPTTPTFASVNRKNPERIAERDRLTGRRPSLPQNAEQSAMSAINDYSAGDTSEKGHEAYAQAFANAWDYLSTTAANPTDTPRQLLAEYERTAPGTGQLVMQLLREPLFEKHPFVAGFPAPTERPRGGR